jgi:hypothetical protein
MKPWLTVAEKECGCAQGVQTTMWGALPEIGQFIPARRLTKPDVKLTIVGR